MFFLEILESMNVKMPPFLYTTFVVFFCILHEKIGQIVCRLRVISSWLECQVEYTVDGKAEIRG